MNVVYRYGNRKMYFASESRYVNYPELLKWEREGKEYRIKCHKTRNDITYEILTKAKAWISCRETYERKIF